MHPIARVAEILQAQRGSLFPWVPVFFGLGIGIYFSLKIEPSTHAWAVLGSVLAGLVVLARWRRGTILSLCATATLVTGLGIAVAGWRAHDVAGPTLGWRYYGPIEGRVVALDRSASDAVRVTLDRVDLGRISAERTPLRVRISLHGAAEETPPLAPGMRIMTTGHLSPPNGPVEPGGFDFQRHSWFLQLGAVGYTRNPVLGAAPPDVESLSVRIFQMRMAVSRFVQNAMPGDVGGFAAAVTAGDRSGISQDALLHLRASNLAHLLAISGLHMGLLTGFVFAALCIGLVLVPGLGLQWPTRKIAAAGALVAGAFYLALSGGNVATERAYIMAAVMLGAVMLDRRAISLRSVAFAAMIVLVLRPEALLGPGFQMSFSATTALVASYNAVRDAPWRFPKWTQPVTGVLFSSGIAGFATAPFAAAHFNAVAHYGLMANLVSVPVMGILVVPAAVVAVLLAPLGLAWLALGVMGWGLSWILIVAEFTATLPGARSFVVSPSPWVLPLLTLGALTVILWQGRLRWVGLAPIVLSFVIWPSAPRPDLLIADNGGLVGIVTQEGRALSRERGAGFVARNWLENDGDATAQDAAYARWVSVWAEAEDRVATARFAGRDLFHLTGKRAARTPPVCENGILVSNEPLSVPSGSCAVFDPKALEHTGAVALRVLPDGTVETKTARQVAGDRLWTRWPEPEPGRDQYVRINPTSLP